MCHSGKTQRSCIAAAQLAGPPPAPSTCPEGPSTLQRMELMRTVPGPPEGVRWDVARATQPVRSKVHEGVALEGDACTVCNRSLLSGPLWVAALEAPCSCTIAHLNQGAGYCARRPPLARLAAVPLAAVPLAAASGAAAAGRPCSHAKAHQGRVANGPPRRPCSARVVWLLPHPIEPHPCYVLC